MDILRLQVGAGCDENADRTRLVVVRGHVKRRVAGGVDSVDVYPLVMGQSFQDADVPVRRGRVER